MNRNILFLLFCFSFIVAGCNTETAQRGVPETARVGVTSSDVGVMDGALITHEMEDPTKVDVISSDNVVIVQCPACNQRVDVTGLPRDRIRCPNCNSLFTY